jgi:uncharacterized protein (TIGR00369 family)
VRCESPPAAAFQALRPKAPTHTRIDNSAEAKKSGDVLMKGSKRGRNVIHHTLKGEGMIEAYEIYVNESREEMVAVVQIGKDMCGYPGAVHGGVSAALIDNTAGWHYLVLAEKKPGVTAYLNLNYRSVIKAGTPVVITQRLREVKGRKYYIDITMTDEHGKVLVEAEALFVQLKPSWTRYIGDLLVQWGF